MPSINQYATRVNFNLLTPNVLFLHVKRSESGEAKWLMTKALRGSIGGSPKSWTKIRVVANVTTPITHARAQ